MASNNPDKGIKYGMDKEISQAMDAKFDQKSANECISWIAELSGSKIALGDMAVLKSGVDLCLAVNKLTGSKIKINNMNSPFFQRENIKNFLEAVKAYGVRDSDLFVTEDLYSGNNYVAVIDCIRSLNGMAAKKGATKTVFGISSQAGEKTTSNFKFDVKATGDTSGMTKQTAGSIYFGAESRNDSVIKSREKALDNSVSKQTSGSVYFGAEKRNDSIIKTNQKAVDSSISQQNAGSVEQKAEKRMDNVNRLANFQ
jgi:hypothetical protein